jgi:hypothetical protein
LKKIGLNSNIYLQRWLKCVFNREFQLKDVLIIWDYILSSTNISKDYNLYQIDVIVLSMLIRIRNYLLLCDQSQCFMILLKYPKIENILELIIFSDKLNEAINEIISGKKSLFLDNITNFSTNIYQNNNNEINAKNNNNETVIKTYTEGVKRLGNIFTKYVSKMDNHDQKEFLNIINFFSNYK